MQSFDTFWTRCKNALHGPDFAWPDNVASVNYPANEAKDDCQINKNRADDKCQLR